MKSRILKYLGLTLVLLAGLRAVSLPSQASASAYITAPGDTLISVADATGCDVELLAAINDLAAEAPLSGGLLLTLADEPALSHEVQSGDTLYSLARSYGCDMDLLAAINNLQPPYLIFPGQKLLLPLAEERTCLPGLNAGDMVTASALLSATLAPAGALIWPVQGVISSPFGARDESFHYGLDIAVDMDTAIHAAAAGRVIEAGWKNSGYGYAVLIDHGSGVVTLYGHCSEVLAEEGQWVEQGETVALSGSTGNSTGPHVHFEVRIDDDWYDPLDYLPVGEKLL